MIWDGITVDVGVTVGVFVLVGVVVDVFVAVPVGLGVCVTQKLTRFGGLQVTYVGVMVAVGGAFVAVRTGVLVDVGLGVLVGVALGVLVAVAVAVGVDVGVLVGVLVEVFVAVCVGFTRQVLPGKLNESPAHVFPALFMTYKDPCVVPCMVTASIAAKVWVELENVS